MACKLFEGFDIAANVAMGTVSYYDTILLWTNLLLGRGVYHGNGVATEDKSIGPPDWAWDGSTYDRIQPISGRTSGSGGYGVATGDPPWGAASNPTRATANTAKFLQLAFVRSVYGIGAEVWLSFDFIVASTHPAATTLTSAYMSTAAYGAMFRWGDLALFWKNDVYNATTGLYQNVFSLQSNGVEVTTLTVNETAQQTWHHVRIYAKLDAVAGAFTVTIDAIPQASAYAGQNTVPVTALVDAPYIYFGPPICDNGTTCYGGQMDNLYVDDAAFCVGHPKGELVTVTADSSLTNWAAEGTSPTTVVNALNIATDAKAARGNAAGAEALLTCGGRDLNRAKRPV